MQALQTEFDNANNVITSSSINSESARNPSVPEGAPDSVFSEQNDADRKDGQGQPVPEFLHQLMKMLTDDNHEIIEWKHGKIRLHDPARIEEILGKYFRHSKFASFQRQLNYFGFRKIAGKGKLSPCTYTNEVATSDIRSLLLIKRKTNGSAARKLAAAERAVAAASPAAPPPYFPLNSLPSPVTASAAAALNAQLGLLALHHQHQQLQAQLMQQQQKVFLEQQQNAIMEQQQNALIEQHHKALLEQHRKQLQLKLQSQNTMGTSSLTAASLGQGGNAAASAVVAAATKMARAPSISSANPATAALAALAAPAAASVPEPAPAPVNPNVLESVANLKSLLDDSCQQQPQDMSQLLRQRLPSQSTIFPESSLLSLNSYFSRNNSVADLEKR